MLSTKYRLELTDICCRMITTDGVSVTLAERIWMNKLCEHNLSAKSLATSAVKVKSGLMQFMAGKQSLAMNSSFFSLPFTPHYFQHYYFDEIVL